MMYKVDYYSGCIHNFRLFDSEEEAKKFEKKLIKGWYGSIQIISVSPEEFEKMKKESWFKNWFKHNYNNSKL